jgi:pimeloyl-ACP methyl ester carboxylesterase
VYLPVGPSGDVNADLTIPEVAGWYAALSREFHLVRYTLRGFGLSRPCVDNYSLDALVGDLETVVDTLGLGRFALWGNASSGPIAIAYAAKHPERVSHLILWCTYARASEYLESPRVSAPRHLIEKDWELYTQTMAHVRLGWPDGPPASRFATMMRSVASPEQTVKFFSAWDTIDVTPLLGLVQAPTLVLNRKDLAWLDTAISVQLAAGIKGARLEILDGDAGVPYLGDPAQVTKLIAEFVKGDQRLGTASEQVESRPSAHRVARVGEYVAGAVIGGVVLAALLYLISRIL